MGMGETSHDLVDVALRLRELEVESIPVNFLIPIDGNPVLTDGSLTPERCLRALALMRLVNPRAEIRVAGGREGHLRGLGALALWPANSLFVEGYLTTRGDAVNDTYRMIHDAGFEIAGNAGSDEHWNRATSSGAGFRLPGEAPLLKPDVTRGA
jgi:biotin synthase